MSFGAIWNSIRREELMGEDILPAVYGERQRES
jgi:hypothetical protein